MSTAATLLKHLNKYDHPNVLKVVVNATRAGFSPFHGSLRRGAGNSWTADRAYLKAA